MKTIPGTWDRTYQCYHTPYAYGTNIRVFSAIRDDLSLLSHRTEEPPATRGDRWVGAGVAIIALALAGMIWAGWVKW